MEPIYGRLDAMSHHSSVQDLIQNILDSDKGGKADDVWVL